MATGVDVARLVTRNGNGWRWTVYVTGCRYADGVSSSRWSAELQSWWRYSKTAADLYHAGTMRR